MTSRDTRILADFVALCAYPECPLCVLVQRAEVRTVQVFCAEGAGDEQRRADVRAARGLCVHHGAILRDARDALAAAVTALDVMTNLLRDLDAIQRAPRWPKPRIKTPEQCPVCAEVARYNRAVCAGIVAWAADETFQHALAHSHGICAPHLRTIAGGVVLPAAFYDAQRTAWQRVHADVAEYIRKRDDRYRHEPDAHEADAWRRAWKVIAGTFAQPDSPQ
ncbi:MAG: hypothetical protein RLY87_1301 [Chloroflexota bacterium]